MGLTLDDLRLEVRRSRRLGLDVVEVRRRMACPSCSADGRAFSAGPTLLRVPVRWPEGPTGQRALAEVLGQVLRAAREAGLDVAED